MSLLRKIADWFVDEGKRYTETFHPESAVPATAADHLDWVQSPAPMQKSLDELLAVVTRVRIVDAGMDRLTGQSLDGPLIADVTAPAQVAALRAHLAVIEDPEVSVYCRCCGSPTLELYTGDAQRAGVGLHHGESIRWNRWDRNAPLADPPAFLEVMADLGADGPLREFQQAHGPGSGVAGRIAGTNWVDLKLWQPSRPWASVVGPAAIRLARDPGDVQAWAELAMMLGDSAAPDLGLIVCLHAQRLRASEEDRARLGAHLMLCLMQVGLARPKDPGPMRVSSLDDGGRFVVSEARLDAWTARHLAVFDGDLQGAADFVLRLALARTGLRKDEPDLFAAAN